MKTIGRYGKNADRALGLWVKLARSYSVFNKVSTNDIRRHGLTQPQFGAMECLFHLGPMTIGALSRKMLVSGGNMTCVIDNLEQEGFVRRIHPPEDRRSVIIDLTSDGSELIGRIFPDHARVIEQVASVLTRTEQTELARLLKKIGTGISDS
jgi:MarR family 2-MHQ and catechol resistance regulon transcriptional repressor